MLIFALSFASMVFILGGNAAPGGNHANVIGSHGSHGEEEVHHSETTEYDHSEGNIDLLPQMVEEIALFRTGQYPAVLTDRDLNVLRLGEGFCLLLGEDSYTHDNHVKYEEIFGNKNIFSFINADDVPEFAALNLKLLNEGVDVDAMGPFRLKFGEEAEKLVMMSASPVKNYAGDVEYIVFQFRDLSDKVEAVTDGWEEIEVVEEVVDQEEASEEIEGEEAEVEEEITVSDYLSSVFD